MSVNEMPVNELSADLVSAFDKHYLNVCTHATAKSKSPILQISNVETFYSVQSCIQNLQSVETDVSIVRSLPWPGDHCQK